MDQDRLIEQRAWRAARRAGLYAKKSRDRTTHCNNHGGFMLVDGFTNTIVAGTNYDMTAEEVIEYCKED